MFIKGNTDVSFNYSIIIDPIDIDAVILIFNYQIMLNFRLLSVKFKITYNFDILKFEFHQSDFNKFHFILFHILNLLIKFLFNFKIFYF